MFVKQLIFNPLYPVSPLKRDFRSAPTGIQYPVRHQIEIA
jgi:hypothetical protein